jgi:predicted metal-dependent hydrolase
VAQKQIVLSEVGTVTMVKRRGARNIRLSLTPDGGIRVSLPTWLPYRAATEFVKQKKDWIAKHQGATPAPITSGQRVGKAHRLDFHPSATATKPTSRSTGQIITVTYPAGLTSGSEVVQAVAHRASLKALQREAEQLLPQRLNNLAQAHGFSYKSVGVRRLKSRWGSCSSKKEITLNYYLMQLPWPLIDYVLLHELTHTKHLNHSKAFWAAMDELLPNVKDVRKQLKAYRPWLLTY